MVRPVDWQTALPRVADVSGAAAARERQPERAQHGAAVQAAAQAAAQAAQVARSPAAQRARGSGRDDRRNDRRRGQGGRARSYGRSGDEPGKRLDVRV